MRRFCVAIATDFFAAAGYTGAHTSRGGDWLVGVGVLNFCVNVLLLAGTRQLAGRRVDWRVFAAAGIGGACAGSCLIPGFAFLGQLHWHVVCLLLMAALAFGVDGGGRKQGAVFLLLSLALEGLAALAGRGDSWPMLLCAVGIRVLSRFGLVGWIGQRYVPIEIVHGGGTVRLTALHDTGNELRDPLTGEAVLILAEKPAQQVTGLNHRELSHPLETIGRHPGLRLIPYRGVGTEQGMLLAKRLPQVRVGGKMRPVLVAFAPTQLGGEWYQALTGGVL